MAVSVKALNAKGMAGATQGQIETMTEYAKSFGAKGLAFIKVERSGDASSPQAGETTEASQPRVEWKSPIVKFFSDAEKARAHHQACDSGR